MPVPGSIFTGSQSSFLTDMLSVAIQMRAGGLLRLANGGTTRVTRKVVLKTAFDIEATAKRRITDQDAVDTGATRATIYVAIEGPEANYGERAGEGLSVSPGIELLGERQPPTRDGMSASIGPSTNYAPFIEFGTRSTPARPFMVPALLDHQQAFLDALKTDLENEGRL